MKGFWPLLKKEIKEQMRTYRAVVVGGVFVFFGLSTPLLLKYLPEIVKLAGEQVPVTIPPPTAAQSLVEYAGTIGQVGVLVAVLVGMGSISNELQRGTAVMTLSKPVSRSAFVNAKLAAMSLTFVLSLLVASAFCFVYTLVLIGEAGVGPFVVLNLLAALFLVFSLAVTLLFSSLFSSSIAAGGVSIAVLIGQAVLSSVPVIGDYMPGKLLGWGNALVQGGAGKDYWWCLALAIALIGFCLYASQWSLKNREM